MMVGKDDEVVGVRLRESEEITEQVKEIQVVKLVVKCFGSKQHYVQPKENKKWSYYLRYQEKDNFVWQSFT